MHDNDIDEAHARNKVYCPNTEDCQYVNDVASTSHVLNHTITTDLKK